MSDCEHWSSYRVPTASPNVEREVCGECGQVLRLVEAKDTKKKPPAIEPKYIGTGQLSEGRLADVDTERVVPMLLHCPECHKRHVDRGAFATRPHHTHACQHCGCVWRPAIVATVGVQFLPGFRDEEVGREL